METTNIHTFCENIHAFFEKVVELHAPLKVTRRDGEPFVVVSAEEWKREQETLYVLQNSSLMRQIAESTVTHGTGD